MNRETAKKIASHYFDDPRRLNKVKDTAAYIGRDLHFETSPKVSIGRLMRAMNDPLIEDISLSTHYNYRGEIKYQVVITFKEDMP